MNFWKNKRVLITGHTGFKGGWLSLWLQSLGATVIGISLEPPTQPNLFSVAHVEQNIHSVIGNIGDFALMQNIQEKYQPEIVFHLAAQPLVRASYLNPIETYSTNVMGTVHLLESIRQQGSTVKAVIIITSDKCYENQEWFWAYREHDRLGGHDPYSNSKACAELVSTAFRQSFSLNIATARAGNVLGGGDWAQDRLIPDIIRSLNNHTDIIIRYPHALRPWQHVLEPLHGYLQLAEKLYMSPTTYAEAWNFGPNEQDIKSVSWIVDRILELSKSSIRWRANENQLLHEASYLNLDSTKSKIKLGWQPRWNLKTGLQKTMDWYQAYQAGHPMREITLSQINSFMTSPSIPVAIPMEELANAIN